MVSPSGREGWKVHFRLGPVVVLWFSQFQDHGFGEGRGAGGPAQAWVSEFSSFAERMWVMVSIVGGR